MLFCVGIQIQSNGEVLVQVGLFLAYHYQEQRCSLYMGVRLM